MLEIQLDARLEKLWVSKSIKLKWYILLAYYWKNQKFFENYKLTFFEDEKRRC
jgi:hypothetical protein